MVPVTPLSSATCRTFGVSDVILRTSEGSLRRSGGIHTKPFESTTKVSAPPGWQVLVGSCMPLAWDSAQCPGICEPSPAAKVAEDQPKANPTEASAARASALPIIADLRGAPRQLAT